MSTSRHFGLHLLCGCLAFGAGAALASAQAALPANPARAPEPAHPAFEEFKQRCAKYADERKRHEAALPAQDKSDTDARRIAAHKDALATAIRGGRGGARQGDLFFPDARDALLTIIRTALAGPETASARQAMRQGNPVVADKTVTLAVNAPYPPGRPLSTVPSPLLLKLPSLPEDLQYHFSDDDLILLDMRSQLVVDVIPGAARR